MWSFIKGIAKYVGSLAIVLGVVLVYLAGLRVVMAPVTLPEHMLRADLVDAVTIAIYMTLGAVPALIGYRTGHWDLCTGCALSFLWPLSLPILVLAPPSCSVLARRGTTDDHAHFAVVVMPVAIASVIAARYCSIHMRGVLCGIVPIMVGVGGMLLALAVPGWLHALERSLRRRDEVTAAG